MAEASDRRGLLFQNLKDAGCDEDTISKCMALAAENDRKELLRLLSDHKRNLLKIIHSRQKEIDCLDYLVFILKQTEHKGGKS